MADDDPSAGRRRHQNRAPESLPREARSGPVYLIVRLFQLWGIAARLDLIWVFRDMRTFAMWVTSDTIFNFATITGMLLLAERFAGVGVWTRAQFIFMLGYAAAVSGLVETLFGFNVAMISRRIGRGQLDHALIQPLPLWMTLLTEGFVPVSGGITALPGLLLMAWAWPALGINSTPAWFGMLLLDLAASAGIAVAFQFIWGSLAFWAPVGAEEISSSSMQLIQQLKSFPLDGLGGATAMGLLTLLPVGFIAWVPCRWLLGLDRRPQAAWETVGAAVIFALCAKTVFGWGLKHYGTVGSQRYSGWGHRS